MVVQDSVWNLRHHPGHPFVTFLSVRRVCNALAEDFWRRYDAGEIMARCPWRAEDVTPEAAALLTAAMADPVCRGPDAMHESLQIAAAEAAQRGKQLATPLRGLLHAVTGLVDARQTVRRFGMFGQPAASAGPSAAAAGPSVVAPAAASPPVAAVVPPPQLPSTQPLSPPRAPQAQVVTTAAAAALARSPVGSAAAAVRAGKLAVARSKAVAARVRKALAEAEEEARPSLASELEIAEADVAVAQAELEQAEAALAEAEACGGANDIVASSSAAACDSQALRVLELRMRQVEGRNEQLEQQVLETRQGFNVVSKMAAAAGSRGPPPPQQAAELRPDLQAGAVCAALPTIGSTKSVVDAWSLWAVDTPRAISLKSREQLFQQTERSIKAESVRVVNHWSKHRTTEEAQTFSEWAIFGRYVDNLTAFLNRGRARRGEPTLAEMDTAQQLERWRNGDLARARALAAEKAEELRAANLPCEREKEAAAGKGGLSVYHYVVNPGVAPLFRQLPVGKDGRLPPDPREQQDPGRGTDGGAVASPGDGAGASAGGVAGGDAGGRKGKGKARSLLGKLEDRADAPWLRLAFLERREEVINLGLGE